MKHIHDTCYHTSKRVGFQGWKEVEILCILRYPTQTWLAEIRRDGQNTSIEMGDITLLYIAIHCYTLLYIAIHCYRLLYIAPFMAMAKTKDRGSGCIPGIAGNQKTGRPEDRPVRGME